MKPISAIAAVCATASLIGLTSCEGLFGGHSDGPSLTTTTTFTSGSVIETSSFGTQSIRRQSKLRVSNSESEGGTFITPDNVTGKAVALIFTTGQSEGVDVFGPLRPDTIQPDDDELELVDFDFSEQVEMDGDVTLQSGFQGNAETDNMVIVIGYMDLHFTLAEETLTSENNIIRIALGDNEDLGLTRGDKQLKIGGEFKWYDQVAEEFVDERPSSPAVIENIRDFYSENEPNMHFYFLNLSLAEPVDLSYDTMFGSLETDAIRGMDEEAEDESSITGTMSAVIDFSVGEMFLLEDINDTDGITDSELLLAAKLTDDIDINSNGDGLSVTANVSFGDE